VIGDVRLVADAANAAKAANVADAANAAARALTGQVSGGCHLFSGCGFPAPGVQNFYFEPIFSVGSFHFTKPMLVAVICVVSVIAFFAVAFRKPQPIPRGIQNLGEFAILQVRDQIVRPTLGQKGDKYMPLLVSLFFYIWLFNIMELIPVLQFPAMAKTGFILPMVGTIYVLYLYLGFRYQGAWGYIYNMWPHDVPWMILPLLIPIELLRFFVIQPFTLGIRLFANMFAGHLLLAIFMVATWYLMSFSIGLLYAVGSAAMVLFVFVLEFLVDLLQAFIFTTLVATYIESSLEVAH
jgi:F-type H+-transporting ATPase subunit a